MHTTGQITVLALLTDCVQVKKVLGLRPTFTLFILINYSQCALLYAYSCGYKDTDDKYASQLSSSICLQYVLIFMDSENEW